MSKTYTAYLPTDGVLFTTLVEQAKREARRASGHSAWDLNYVDEYHREVGRYNDQGRKIGVELQAKVVLNRA